MKRILKPIYKRFTAYHRHNQTEGPKMKIPTMKCFKTKDHDIRVWCPFCAGWHGHGAPNEPLKGGMSLGHRASPCWTENPLQKTGYNLKLATKKEIIEIGKGIEFYK